MHTEATLAGLDTFVEELERTGHGADSVRLSGISRATINRRRREDPAYGARCREALARFQARKQAAARADIEARVPRGEIEEAAPAAAPQAGAPGTPATIAWSPLAGPQTAAYDSPADILLYGGAAGGGKSDLLLGLALTRHRRAIIFRREFSQLRALEDRAAELIGASGRLNAQRHTWRFPGHRILELGAVQTPGDELKYQGRAHDLKAFDEITHFTERQFRFLIGWNRSPNPEQRVRVVAAGNPPVGAEGDWIIKFWGPWLDRTHPNPAQPGELRWYATVGGKEIECPGPTPIFVGEDGVWPLSRTFLPARVEDNPYLIAAGYKATLQALPEPLRSQMLHGDFSVQQQDDPMQAIPTAWVLAAQARWTAVPPGPMDALGVDVARGGADRTVLTPRHGRWFGWPVAHDGSATPDGAAVAAHIVALLQGHAVANIDVVGIGAAVYDIAKGLGLRVEAMNGSAAAVGRDRSGQLGFVNARAQWWWTLREALDPERGDGIMLPPTRERLADLTAPRWRLAPRGIQIDSKDEIRARIGRSPDAGDSLVYAFGSAGVSGGGLGLLEWYRQEAEKLKAAQAEEQVSTAGKWRRFGPDGRMQALNPWTGEVVRRG